MKGLFITFEGGECSGKTTLIKALKEYYEAKNYNTIVTREPGGTPIAEQIRNVILDNNNVAMTSKCEALLYAASRMQHVEEKILPALKEGKLVFCDRFLDSSLAYQGYARGLGFDLVLKANQFVLDYLPDVTILIDIKPEVALKRLSTRTDKVNRLDAESLKFHQLVYEGYEKLLTIYPNRIKKIDGTKSEKEVVAEAIKIIDSYLVKLCN